MSNESEVTYIDMDDGEMTAEEKKAFADKVVYYLGFDPDKREISIIIPKDSPKASPNMFTAKQKEKAILTEVRRQIRELL